MNNQRYLPNERSNLGFKKRLREGFYKFLRDSFDIETFAVLCFDYYPHIYAQFENQKFNLQEKQNLLLDHCDGPRLFNKYNNLSENCDKLALCFPKLKQYDISSYIKPEQQDRDTQPDAPIRKPSNLSLLRTTKMSLRYFGEKFPKLISRKPKKTHIFTEPNTLKMIKRGQDQSLTELASPRSLSSVIQQAVTGATVGVLIILIIEVIIVLIIVRVINADGEWYARFQNSKINQYQEYFRFIVIPLLIGAAIGAYWELRGQWAILWNAIKVMPKMIVTIGYTILITTTFGLCFACVVGGSLLIPQFFWKRCDPGPNQVMLFANPKYNGSCTVKGVNDLPSIDISNGQLSSIRIGKDVLAFLYTDNRLDSCILYTEEDIPDLTRLIGDQQILSIKVIEESKNFSLSVEKSRCPKKTTLGSE